MRLGIEKVAFDPHEQRPALFDADQLGCGSTMGAFFLETKYWSTELSVSNSLSFKCPHCGTAYRVVPVQGMAATDAEVNCLASGKHSFFQILSHRPAAVQPPTVVQIL